MIKSLNKCKSLLLIASLIAVIVLVACSSEDSDASVDSYPDGSIEMVVPAGAGGDTDRNARLLAQYLEEELDVSIVIQNVEGSSGSVGIQEVLDSEADGYRVVYFHNGILLNNILGLTETKYTALKIAGISELDEGNGIVVSGDSEFEDISDLIDAAIENPGEINVGSSLGSFTHIQLLDIEEKTGAKFNFVDAGDHADRNASLLGGQVDVIPTQLGLVNEYLESGDMKALGVLSEERLEQFPDVSTLNEQGIDATFEKFFFTAFHPDTPDEVVSIFSEALESVTNNEEYINKALDYGITPQYFNPEEAEQLMEDREKTYKEIHENSQ